MRDSHSLSQYHSQEPAFQLHTILQIHRRPGESSFNMHNSFLFAASFAALASALPYTLKPEHNLPTRTLNPATPVRRATGEVVTGSVATPVNDSDGNGAGSDTYTLHTGNGAAGWPNLGQWVNFEDMFSANTNLMNQACGNNGWGANDSPTEIANIKTAIESVAATTKVDHRFILAVIMQESGGCVRVPTTTSPDGTVRNPGLMQDHNGAASCSGVNPCPQSTVSPFPHFCAAQA